MARLVQVGALPGAEPVSPPSLGAALDPEQSLSSGTTTATIEWPAATGGTAPLTYNLSVKDEAGSSVTPDSGSAQGPYVIPVADGKSYRCEIGVTDAEGLTARRSAMVHVAAVASGGWETLLDLDLTGLDSATLASNTTTNVTRSAATVAAVKVLDYNSNGGTVSAGASGITVAGLSASAGHMAAGIDLEAHLGLTLPDDVLSDIVVHIHLDGLAGWTGGSDAWQAGLMKSSGINFSLGNDLSVRGNYDAVGQDRFTSTNDGNTSWAANEATPAGAWVVSMLLRGGQIAEAWYTLGATAPNDATIDAGGRILASTLTAGGARWAATDLWAVVRTVLRVDVVWTRLVVKRRL